MHFESFGLYVRKFT